MTTLQSIEIYYFVTTSQTKNGSTFSPFAKKFLYGSTVPLCRPALFAVVCSFINQSLSAYQTQPHLKLYMICKVEIRQLRYGLANQDVRDNHRNEMAGLRVAEKNL
jgi:hypothetical protein